MNTVLDIAFVLVIVSFLKEQLGLKGYAVLGVAFVVALIFGIAPLVAQLLPEAAPWLTVFLDTVVLFLGACGSYDLVTSVTRKKAK
jgi:hypothetical protein